MTYDFDKYKHEFAEQVKSYKQRGLKMFATSSFQPQSIVMLHLISEVDKSIPVYFLDTRYHFPETVDYRNAVEEKFGLDIIDIRSEIPKEEQVDAEGQPLHVSNPEHCCHINKVLPLENVLKKNDVWINGVRKTQTVVRSNLSKEVVAKHGVLRYHPILDWDSKMVYTYINQFDLPIHPLVREGYFSVGCQPCTQRPNLDGSLDVDDRSGRWAGSAKTECGIHTTLMEPAEVK